jgi:hypothetical protein
MTRWVLMTAPWASFFGMSTAGALLFAASFIGLLALPVNFPYWAFALTIAVNGTASGMFASPNTASIMSAVPADQRGVASGMRATFQNPVSHLLGTGTLNALPAASRQTLTGREFFPHLISAPFHQGLTVVSAGLAVFAALASLLRGKRDPDRAPR